MNVLIAADMEGIAGIEDYRDCLPSHPAAYVRGRRQMTDEVLVAIEALRAGGVEAIGVGDWHMVGTNVERERMPAGVEVRPIADLALNEAEPSMAKAHGGPLDAVVMIGHHAKTPSPKGFCSHTFIWGMEVLLDGDSLSETQTYAQALGAEGIPILVAAGDRWLLEETRDGELGSARLVTTKEGEGRGRAASVEPADAHLALRGAIAGALSEPLATAAPAVPGRAGDQGRRRGDRPHHRRRAGRAADRDRRPSSAPARSRRSTASWRSCCPPTTTRACAPSSAAPAASSRRRRCAPRSAPGSRLEVALPPPESTLAERADLREEMIDAWEMGDSGRFGDCLIELGPDLPDELPRQEICFLVCRMVELSWGIELVEVYRWKDSGKELTDDEVKSLEGAVNSATGQSALDFLIAAGVIERSTKIKIHGGQGRKCEKLCFIV